MKLARMNVLRHREGPAPQTVSKLVVRMRFPARSCREPEIRLRCLRMSTLAEIEKAADTLPPQEKQELILFLAARLRAAGARLPDPRHYSREQVESWIAEDEADLQRFQRGA